MAQCERQLAIRDYISEKRATTYRELMELFGVSRTTIIRDLAAITPITCFEIVAGRNGGIHALEGWYSNHRYLNAKQAALLKRLSTNLQPDDSITMQSILSTFVMPLDLEKAQ